MLYGERIIDYVAGSYGFGDVFRNIWRVLQWPIALAFMLLAFALIYFFAPDLHDQEWTWVTPGSAIGVGLWLLVSFALRIYLHFFNSYSKTYGSLGAVIILMLWLYLTGAAILIGGEVNSEIEDAAAKAGAPDAKEKGQKAPDEKKDKRRTESSVPERENARVQPTRPAYARRKQRDRRGVSIGAAIATAGAFFLALVQRVRGKGTTIHKGR